MNIAYLTEFDVKGLDKSAWRKSQLGHWGRCYYIAKSLEDESTNVQYFGPLTKKNALLPKLKSRLYNYLFKQTYHLWADPIFNKNYGHQIAKKISIYNSDIVFSPDINFISYLNCKQPIVLWVDTLYTGLIDYYDDFSNLCLETKQHLTAMDRLTLNKCSLVIFSSEWTAKTAIEIYQINEAKIKIVPFGANIESNRTIDDINELVKARSSKVCKMLFIGVDWFRKGGNVALEVAKELNKAGLNTELTIVGCQPVTSEPLPSFVKSLGFIDKSKKEGNEKLNKLLAESHFFILPSRAECYGHVFCEANSFGVPCLATDVGGIPSVIRNGMNGRTFPVDANISDYCNYVASLMKNYQEYENLALSSFNEYQTRLNWTVAAQTVKKLLRELI
ncbi:glycosyltransferase family 4 protein [Aerosakkonema funiforme]|uniref:glycosyltransferase family 4 protein n=1 Tax=Aerosakkonema funiforme TaxID=1246630 RepID=UPI0035B749FF